MQCAGAMEYMCTRCGLHHGNLKSANLLLDDDYAVV
jgi:serine/threonine-protein kinase RIO1